MNIQQRLPSIVFIGVALFFGYTSFFAPLLGQRKSFLQRPRRGKFSFAINPSLRFETTSVQDHMLSYSEYETTNLNYHMEVLFMAHQFDVVLGFDYAPQNYFKVSSGDLDGKIESYASEIFVGYYFHLKKNKLFWKLGGQVLGHSSTRQTTLYDSQLLVGEVFISGLGSLSVMKKLKILTASARLDLPLISYVFGKRYSTTHPLSDKSELTISDAFPRNLNQREQSHLWQFLSSEASFLLPHQFFYGTLTLSLTYPMRKGLSLHLDVGIRHLRFEHLQRYRSYQRSITLGITYRFIKP